MMEIILASASPRRAELLRQVGAEFIVLPAAGAEVMDESLPLVERISALALHKAQEVAAKLAQGLVLGADTVVVCDEQILGKPRDEAEAKAMLQLLSGRTHQVITGVAVVNAASGEQWCQAEISQVTFRALSAADIEAYLATGESMDKAGAYGIQGFGALLVERIAGCYFNIVGLPLKLVADGLRTMGVDLYRYDKVVG